MVGESSASSSSIVGGGIDGGVLHDELRWALALGRLQAAGRRAGSDCRAVAEARALPAAFGGTPEARFEALGRMFAALEAPERRVLGAWFGRLLLSQEDLAGLRRHWLQGVASEGGWPGASSWWRREWVKARVRQASPRRSRGMASSVLLHVGRFAAELWGGLLRVAATAGVTGAALRLRITAAALGDAEEEPTCTAAPVPTDRRPGWTERVWLGWVESLVVRASHAAPGLRQGLRALLVSLQVAERQRRTGKRLAPFDRHRLGVV